MSEHPPLGIIEGFYGPLWSWEERRQLVRSLAPRGYRNYWYAPKADAFLRRRWNEPYPAPVARELSGFADFCREQGVRFGVGLSPFEVFNNFDNSAKTALAEKLASFDRLGISDLAILFDDMRSDTSDLAARQADIIHWVAERSGSEQLTVCPSYYSDDPVLDRVFGDRPAHYLEDLGRALDPSVQVFWTGEEVCSREITPGHLQRVSEALRRKPVLWDNYPVNDGDRMSRHLHLRAFTGRPAANSQYLAGHAINPALQPTLTTIPAITLSRSYEQAEGYQYGQAFYQAAEEVLGKKLARQVAADLLVLEDAGLARISGERHQALVESYSRFDHPAAREILRWLAGEYQVTDEMVQTQ
ncbi:beta-N-acetylglucosaminidase domain-containing protein [Marinobacter sp. TBZ242]|uniref:Beta-N-acetylglucosaminidase domain-containing protein n=1 Tax=Marinobacter azerbaijanicus TaxID=3050455 RepID=A0ABT7IAL3_9GAMM|nr:beta-N-acetylglucosaminidase domain-containing protein [Marinobacter sp. TBZ242]MDL0431150.1 beta-N-acetylglucosaminidase domain-containing protein [Marinobacter sp. TBZ242]